MWLHKLVEVLALLRLLHLARELERQARLHCDRDRAVRSFVRAHPAEEEQVLASMRLDGIDGEVQCVRAVGDPVQIRLGLALIHRDRDQSDVRRNAGDQLVDLTGLSVERPVHGVDDRRGRRCAERHPEHPGVIVDDVELVGSSEAGERMLQLPEGPADLPVRRLREHGDELRLRARIA